MGKANHIIQVEPISANGIIIHDEELSDRNNIQKQDFVICLKSNPKIRSKTSLPPRRIVKNNASGPPTCTVRWWHKNEDQGQLSFKTRLDGKNAKSFEFSVRLLRGDVEVEVGVSSLTFVGIILNAELDIPIYKTDSVEAAAIGMKREEKNSIFRRNRSTNSEIIKDIRSQLNSNDTGSTSTAFGGAFRRGVYSLQSDASIRVKCTCMPTSIGKTNLSTLQNILLKEKSLRDSKSLTSYSLSTNYTQDSRSGRLSRGRSTTIYPVQNYDSIALSNGSNNYVNKLSIRTDVPTLSHCTEKHGNLGNDLSITTSQPFPMTRTQCPNRIELLNDNLSFSPSFEEVLPFISNGSGIIQEDNELKKNDNLYLKDSEEVSSQFHHLFSYNTNDLVSMSSEEEEDVPEKNPSKEAARSGESLYSNFSLLSLSSSEEQDTYDENSSYLALKTEDSSVRKNGENTTIAGYGCFGERLLFCR